MDDGKRLAKALARICEAESIAARQVQSIQIVDDEIVARVARPGGRYRLVIYPIALLADRPDAPNVKAGPSENRSG
jgi:hypothetical protein